MKFAMSNAYLAALALLPPIAGLSGAMLGTIHKVLGLSDAGLYYKKFAEWVDEGDPLILDLDGDGIETAMIGAGLRFDHDVNLFAEETGWLGGDDGFLVLDANGNGRVDDGSEFFGGAGQTGVEELAQFDSNGDGIINAADIIWNDLQVWRDADEDAVTDEGELLSLGELGITAINLAVSAVNARTPQGTTLLDKGAFTWAIGGTGLFYDAVFQTSAVDTKFTGEAGRAPWLADLTLDARGFGSIVDLSVAMSNDMEFGTLVKTQSAAMTVPKLSTLVEQAGSVLGRWSQVIEDSRELTAVKTAEAGGKTVLLDHAVYAEDAAGGYYQLASGAPVLDAAGQVIARPTLFDVDQMDGWRIEQAFSPAARGQAPQFRAAVPYLVQVENGRAQVLDYGIRTADGSWALASGAPVVDEDGAVISAPTVEDILSQAHAAGTEWRTEAIAHNPYANVPVEKIGIQFKDGQAVNYTVEVTDRDGTFLVWASNLEMALEVQSLTGDARAFNLRNFEVVFNGLDEVGSSDDSFVRVEVLTPGQMHFATSLSGVDFRPQMLSAAYNDATGILSYSVNDTGTYRVGSLDGKTPSDIGNMMKLLENMMELYVETSRAFAVRLAMQGGLQDYLRGLTYDVTLDKYVPLAADAGGGREMAPLFEAIFEDAPAGDGPTQDYLKDWAEILWQIYPDYVPDGSHNQYGARVSVNQPYIMQMALAAYENVGLDVGLPAMMDSLGVNEDYLRTELSVFNGITKVMGTQKEDYFHLTGAESPQYEGGFGSDFYFAGKDFGQKYIYEFDDGKNDELRFAHMLPEEIGATRDGEDLILTVKAGARAGDFIRIKDQFKGELNPYFMNGKQAETGVNAIVFANGAIWDRFRMAFEVADPQDGNQTIRGSGSGDVLWGGRGNDVVRGHLGGDIYVFAAGDGQDVFGEDGGGADFGPVKAGIDFIQFMGSISADDLVLSRDGLSNDLMVRIKDAQGVLTGDSILIEDQFAGTRLNFGAFGAVDPGLGLDYVSLNQIERMIFEDGTSLDFEQISQKVIDNAKTDGADAIFGMLNDNSLDGGKGNDLLQGFEGSDTYVFGKGYGQDLVHDQDFSLKWFGDSPDTLSLKDDIRWTDIEFLRDGDGDTLTLKLKDSTDQVTLVDFMEYEPLSANHFNRIETISFGGGVTWDWLQLLQHYVKIAGTSGNDSIYGFETVGDTLDGGAGDDRLEGQSGDDTYIFSSGYGHDTVYDRALPNTLLPHGTDKVIFRSLNSTDVDVLRTATDLIFRIKATGETLTLKDQYNRAGKQANAIEHFEFADRTVKYTDLNPEDVDVVGTAAGETLEGSNFAETIDGRGGNDLLKGGDGGDIYLFDEGYGDDVIIDTRAKGGWTDRKGVVVAVDDIVQFGDDVTLGNVSFAKDADDLVVYLTANGRTDTLRIKDQFLDTLNGIEWFKFKDGTSLSIAQVEQIVGIVGSNRGDNTLTGNPDLPNNFDGKQGDDEFTGGFKGDTYAFTTGYDFDTIIEQADSASGSEIDRVIFGASVRREDLVVRRDGDDLLIDLGGAVDVLRIVNGTTTARVERFEFANGTFVLVDELLSDLLVGTDEDDQLTGFDGRNDVLDGGKGYDALTGGTGDDTYRWGFGDGADSVEDAGGIDTLQFKTGVTRDQVEFSVVDGDLLVTLTQSGERLVVFGNGGTAAAGFVDNFVFDGGDTLTHAEIMSMIRDRQDNDAQDIIQTSTLDPESVARAGAGFDTIYLAADRQIVFGQGDGIDTVHLPSNAGTAQIIFDDLNSTDAKFRIADLNSSDIIITFPETGDQLVLKQALSKSTLPVIEFADGVTMDRTQLLQRLVQDQTSGRGDTIRATASADSIEAGMGDDDISLGGGDDNVVFRRGDGRDAISDSSGNDTLTILGYSATEMNVRRPVAGRDELVITFQNSHDEITLRFAAGAAGIEQVKFSDTTTFTRAQLFAMAVGDGTPFEDDISGSASADTLEGLTGNDILRGLGGGDTYVFNRGDGRDIIDDQGLTTDVNKLVIKGYLPAEVEFRKEAGRPNDLVLMLAGGDEIIIVNGLLSNGKQISVFEFDNGARWDAAYVAAEVAKLPESTGGRIFTGTSAADVFTSTTGDDLFTGGQGGDSYHFSRGDGRDRIEDSGSASTTDTLYIHGYLPGDVSLRVSTMYTNGIELYLGDGSDSILINEPAGGGFVEQVRFDNNTNWLLSDLQAKILEDASTSGDDHIVGFTGADSLNGGLGIDVLSGLGGGDTYTFNAGDGHDFISDGGSGTGDTLNITGYAVGDIHFSTSYIYPQHLRMWFGDGSDSITVFNGLTDGDAGAIESFNIGGTPMSLSDLRQMYLAEQTTTGNDRIYGSDSADTLTGGTGDDVLQGRDGSDIYVFNRGDGRDVIDDNGAGDTDKLKIQGYNFADALFYKPAAPDQTLLIKFVNSTDQITIVNTLNGNAADQIETFEFDDGPQSLASVKLQILPAAYVTITGTTAANAIVSTTSDELMTGLAGADTYTYARGGGNDVIADGDNSGTGIDRLVLSGISSTEVRIGRQDDDAILYIAESAPGAGDGGSIILRETMFTSIRGGIEEIIFSDVTWSQNTLRQKWVDQQQSANGDVILGPSIVNTATGGAGDDYINNGRNADVYYYTRGDGNDYISETQIEINSDKLVLTNIASTEVSVMRASGKVLLIVRESSPGANDGSILVIESGFDPGNGEAMERIEFSDAVIWTQQTLREKWIASAAAQASGGAAYDFDTGDTYNLPASPVAFTHVQGGEGSDTYVFQRGDGHFVVNDEGVADNDRLKIEGYAPEDVHFSAAGNAYPANSIKITFSGTDDEIIVPYTLRGETTFSGELEAVEIVGGPTLSMTDVAKAVVAGMATAGDDWIKGYNYSEVYAGGKGDDVLEGNTKADTYHYTRGDGYDVIIESASEAGDVLYIHGVGQSEVKVRRGYGNDLELLIPESATGAGNAGRITVHNSFLATATTGIEQVIFDGGTTWNRADFETLATRNFATPGDDSLTGTSGADTLEGLRGDDFISGGGGDDIYVFRRGDGKDTVSDAGSGTDKIVIHGYDANEVIFTRRGAAGLDLVIRFVGTADEITVIGGFDVATTGQVESVEIAGSATVLALADIRNLVLAGSATEGDDLLLGDDADNQLAGGLGNDMVSGDAGNDTFIYSKGDGDDRVSDSAGSADRLVLTDYNVADIVHAIRGGPDSLDLVIRFSGERDRLVLVQALADSTATGVDSITFADGTVWTRADMRANAIAYADSAGDDNVHGFSGNDVFDAKAGDDLLAGTSGSDEYRFNRGDGKDTIADSGTSASDTDVVVFTDYVSSEVKVERLFKGSQTVVFTFLSAPGDSLTVVDALAADQQSVETYSFSDGVTWTRADILSRLENRAPVAVSDGYYTAVTGEPLLIAASALLRNDYDADNDALRIVAVDGGASGTAQLDANGDIVFTPKAGFTGATQFQYTLSDGRNGFASATVDVRVRPSAQAHDDAGFSVAEDDFLVIRAERLLSNDADGDRMVIGEVFDAVNGTVSLSSTGDITFTPSENFTGIAQFKYAANTPEGGRAEATVSINVTPLNDAPDGITDSGFSTSENAPFQIAVSTLLRNDRDVDGDGLTIVAVHSTPDVSVQLTADGYVVVTPRDYFFGNAYFEYTVADPDGLTDRVRVNFNVTPVNNAPVAVSDLIEQDGQVPLLEDNPIVLDVADLLANDIDYDGDQLTITSVKGAFGGHVELLENGTILFTPTANFNGDARFTYVVNDGQGGTSQAIATLRYQAVNDMPSANNDSYQGAAGHLLRGTEDQPLEISISQLLGNDFDPEGLSITFNAVGNNIHGDVVQTDHGTLIFTPDADFWGEATFSYIVSDPEGAVDDALVTLWFENVGDAPPVAAPDRIEVREDQPAIIPLALLLGNDTDIDNDTLFFLEWRRKPGSDETPASKATELNGEITIQANGDLLFVPEENAMQSIGFQYRITDRNDPPAFATSSGEAPTGGPSNWADVDIVILPVDDDPVAVNDAGFTTALDVPLVLRVSALIANDYDPDEDGDTQVEPFETFAFAGVGAVSVGTATVESVGGEQFIVVRLPQGYTGAVSVEYKIVDGTGRDDFGYVSATVSNGYSGILNGTPGIDWLEGNDLNETINGLESADAIVALGGDDIINAGDGNDDIRGGAGNDTINGGNGADRIDGGDGIDGVEFTGSNIWVDADLESRLGQGGAAEGDVYLNVENLIGTAFGDTLGGDAAANRLEGRGGNDRLEGRAGDDVLAGGLGNDSLEGGEGADTLDGGEGIDTADYFLSSAAVQVSLAGGTASGGDAGGDQLTSIENLTGSDFDDVLIGDSANNVLFGRRGADLLVGGDGDDTLIGGQGADTMQGGAGFDVVDYTGSATGVVVDLANGLAGSGDAQGDTFADIEVIQGSHHADQLLGDAGANRFRGGDGADLIDGRGGTDIADYSTSNGAVVINLATGQGSGADAAGDQLVSIEHVIGSGYADHLTGSAGADTFDGGYGNDLLAGGTGSDIYVFGYDSKEDTVNEQGNALDVDRLQLNNGIGTRDISLVRQGDSLLVELERDGGLLIDTVLIADHFLGRETGIEEIAFGNGMVWDRDQIEALTRNGRFNAADDLVRFADEDVVSIIDPATLFINDATEGQAQMQLVSVGNAVNGTVTIAGDGKISFLGAANFNGDAFFDYTVRDQFGRESTATVEVNLAPVNDAPQGVNDATITALEDVPLVIRFADLLGNDFDIDGDELTIIDVGPLLDDNGNPLYSGAHPNDVTNGRAEIKTGAAGKYIEFKGDADFFGFAGFTYTLADPDGLTSTATVELYVAPVNDGPRGDDRKTIRLDTTTSISIADLMGNDTDPEGDEFTFNGIHSASNGTMVYDAATGTVLFTPSALGDASFQYDVIDSRGAASAITVELNVIPLNDAPRAHRDSATTLEDQPLVIDVDDLLSNDTDENGDPLSVISVERFPLNGKVNLNGDGTITFIPRADYNGAAGFKYTISDGRGGEATGFVAVTVEPDNDSPQLRDDLVYGNEDEPIVIVPGLIFGNDMEPDGDAISFETVNLLGIMAGDFGNRTLFTEDLGDAGLVTLAAGPGVFTATLANGRALPDWIDFDPATMELGYTELPPSIDATPLRLRVHFTPAPVQLPNGTYASSTGGFSVEFLVDPQQPIDPAINALLASGSTLAGTGQFGIGVQGENAPVVTLENGGPLPDWLSFDAATMAFSGTPPAHYVGAVAVKLDFGNFSVIKDLVVDDTFTLLGTTPAGLNYQLINNRIFVTTPEDFVGDVVFSYTAKDVKNAVSEKPAIIVLDVLPQPERPDALADDIATSEDQPVTVTLASLLANDRDDDGDSFRAIAINQPANGSVVVNLSTVTIDTAAVLGATAGAVFAATLADGSALPSWMVLDPSTGLITALVPLDVLGNFALSLSAALDTATWSASHAQSFDGNAGVTLTYTPNAGVNGTDNFTYVVTEDKQGTGTGQVNVAIAAVNDPPAAVDDLVDGLEDADLTISFALLTGNDNDPDNDPLTITSVSNAVNGTVQIVNGEIVFTPTPNFDGTAGFDYVVTDGDDGSDTGHVNVNVVSTNRKPVVVTDIIAATEDTPVQVNITTLLGNDSDLDGDSISFVSIQADVPGARSFMRPGGIIEFQPDENVNGTVTFTYEITDGRLTSTGQVQVNFAAVNDAPIVVADATATVIEDQVLAVDLAGLIANDVDIEGDSFAVVSVFDGDNGTVQMVGGNAVFTPRANYFGNAGFSYAVRDAFGAESIGYARITVLPEFDVPLPVPDTGISVNEDGFVDVDPVMLLANDVDPDGIGLSFVGLEGAVKLANGLWRFTPEADDFGPVTLTYTVTNSSGVIVPSTVTVNILPMPDAPVAGDDVIAMTEDVAATVLITQLLGNDSDVDLEAVEFSRIVSAAGVNVVEDGQGRLIVSTPANANGTATIVYEVRDITGRLDTATITLNIAAVNDAPEIADTGALAGTEDSAFSHAFAPALFTDVDGDFVTIGLRSAGGAPLPSWLTFNVLTLTLAGNPPANFNGTLALELTASDGLVTTVRPVTLAIAAVNDAPQIGELPIVAVAEDTGVSVTLASNLFADIENDALTVTVLGSNGAVLPSWLAFDAASRTLTGTPPANFNGVVDLQVAVSDGTDTTVKPWQITVEARNDAPVAVADAYSAGRATHIVIPVASLLANDTDADGDTLSVISVSGGDGYTASLDGLGNIVIDRGRLLTGNLTVTYTVSDGTTTSTGELIVAVESDNSAPVIGSIAAIHATEDVALDVSLPAGAFSDPDGDPMTFEVRRAGGGPLPPWLAFNAQTLRMTGTPPANFYGTVALEVVAMDGVLSTTRTFDLVVDPVNDAPVLAAPFSDRYINEEQPFTLQLQNDLLSDPDGDALTYDLKLADGSALPSWINFDPATLTLSGTPPQNFIGTTQLRLYVSDGTTTISDDFALGVINTADPPVVATPLTDKTFSAGVPISIALPSNTFSDPDGDPLQYAAKLANGDPLPSWLNFNGSAFSGTAPVNGTWTIRVLASDGTAQVFDDFVLTIAGGNSTPVAKNDGVLVARTAQTLQIQASQLLANDTDPDGDALQVVEVRGAQHGTVSMTGNVISYKSAAGYTGLDSFIYKVTDGARTSEATVVIGVTPVPQQVHNGTSGSNIFLTGNGSDSINGGDGADLISSGNGADILFGGNGIDLLDAGNGNDWLFGGNGADILLGGNGADFLSGGSGADILFGGNGADTFLVQRGDGLDVVGDFSTGDKIHINMDGVDNFDDLLALGQQQNGGVLFAFGNGDELFLAGTQLAALDRNSFTFY